MIDMWFVLLIRLEQSLALLEDQIDGFIEGLVTRHEFENQRCVDPSKRGLSKEGLYNMFVLETKSQIFLPFDFHHQIVRILIRAIISTDKTLYEA